MKTVAIQTGASIVHDPSTLPNLLFWQAYRPQAHRTSRLRENGVAFYCPRNLKGRHPDETVAAFDAHTLSSPKQADWKW
jgi:hypothetical protein